MATQAQIDAVIAAIRAAEAAKGELTTAQRVYDLTSGVVGASRSLLDAIIIAGTGTDAQLSALALSLAETVVALGAANADLDIKQNAVQSTTSAVNGAIVALSAPAP